MARTLFVRFALRIPLDEGGSDIDHCERSSQESRLGENRRVPQNRAGADPVQT